MRIVAFLCVLIRCLEVFFVYNVDTFIKECVVIDRALILYVALNVQRVRLFGRIVNVSVLGEGQF
jgi:hypothetical protein